MPTTITSSGITFNDATSQTTSALAANAIGTTQIADGSVNLQKLAAVTQTRVAKAWVNFNGVFIQSSTAGNGVNISVISGSNTGTWSSSSNFDTSWNGMVFYIPSIAGVSGATFGGLDVATIGFQVTSVVGTTATIRFLAGNATSSQTINGTGSASTGYTFSTKGIRSSLNVSSITKNGTGDYTVNFTTPMADANYSVSATLQSVTGSTAFSAQKAGTNPTPNSVSIYAFTFAGVLADSPMVFCTIFGN